MIATKDAANEDESCASPIDTGTSEFSGRFLWLSIPWKFPRHTENVCRSDTQPPRTVVVHKIVHKTQYGNRKIALNETQSLTIS